MEAPELNASGETLGEVDIRRGFFQGSSLSPLFFVLCMIPRHGCCEELRLAMNGATRDSN